MNGYSASSNRDARRDDIRFDRQSYSDWMAEERPYEADDGEEHYNGRIPIRSDRAKRILAQIMQNDLTPLERKVLYMRYFRCMRPKTISQELGISIAHVSATTRRAKAKIADYMKYSFL